MSRIRKIAPEPREANPNPAWADVFGEELYDQLVDLLNLGGERDRDYLRNALPDPLRSPSVGLLQARHGPEPSPLPSSAACADST